MLDGTDLVGALWNAVGVVIIFAAVVMIIFKFFLGAQKNVMAGIGCLVGVGALGALAANPAAVIAIGQTVVDWVTGA